MLQYLTSENPKVFFTAPGLSVNSLPLHVHSCLVQVIIKQEPGEVSTQQQQMVSTVTTQQQPTATAAHQFVAVKGGHVISMSPQKQTGGATGATTSKVTHIIMKKHSNPLLIKTDSLCISYQQFMSFRSYIWNFISRC